MDTVEVPVEDTLIHNFGTEEGSVQVPLRLVTSEESPRSPSPSCTSTGCRKGRYFGHLVKGPNATTTVPLERGRWRVSIDDRNRPGRRIELAVLKVDDRIQETTLTIPGVTLRGTLRVPGWKGSLEGRAWVSVRSRGGDFIRYRGTWTGDTSWVLEGVIDGEWDVWGSTRGDTVREEITVSGRGFEVDLTMPTK